ncbi:MAG: SusC/RagA family TonB-linked outer membrane protein, partial [Bacteroides sp.]|nr:SusC/RagA family TonB-linked outer membrane protein [Bacteroides sp.]
SMKGVFKIYILLICLLVLPSSLLAQAGGNTRIMIRGLVTSATDKESLPGANVVLMNKDERIITHAITDLDGNYSLLADVKPGDKLVVSYTGFVKQEISLGTRTTVNVQMEEESFMLEGAVIVAQRRVNNGMLSVNERDLTTAATRISMSDIADNMAGASIDDALQGRIAGMDMTAGSGAPGTGMSIRVRGTTSINGSSQPLIVVDGFPYETEVSSDFDFSNADEEQYSQMLNIAPDDIQEIIVLKDAAATAIYGSRAANGVLQITTKRGTKGKPRISYTFKGTVCQKPSTIPTLTGDQYTTMIQEAMLNSGSLYNPISNPEFAYDVNQPYYFYNYGQNTNWFDEVTQSGFAQDHNLSVTGGGDKAVYRLSLGYYDNEGTIIGTGLQRINTRLNVDYDVSEQIKFQASITYTHSENDQNYITYLNKSYDVSNGAFTRMPNMSIYEYNEIGALTGNYFSPLSSSQGYWNESVSNPYNPVAMANEAYHKFTSDRIISNLSLIYRPASWFRYQFDVSLDVLNEKKSVFLPQTTTGRSWSELQANWADDYDGEAFVLTTYNKAIFTPRLGNKHDFMGLLGINTSDKNAAGYSATTANSASPYLQDPSNPSRVNGSSIVGVGSSKSSNRTVSFFGTVQYGFLDRYLINASLRGDGDSRFGSDYR